MNVGEIFSSTRIARNISKAELARQSGLSTATINNLECGRGHIRSAIAIMAILQLRWAISMSDDAFDIGIVLANARKSKLVSQRSMATYIGVTLPTIQALEQKFTGSISNLVKYLTCVDIHKLVVHKAGDPVASKRRLVPKQNGHEQDLVFTPKLLAGQIIGYFGPDITGSILDPCRGDGAFYERYPQHLDRHWCEIDQGRDFFRCQQPVDWIITNPPWSKFRGFLNHAMTISENVVFLCALTHFSTKARIADIQQAGFAMKTILYVSSPPEWPHTGFQLAAIHLKRGWSGTCDMRNIDS
jgi:transcriptional regulator with XRE-family HTH domain